MDTLLDRHVTANGISIHLRDHPGAEPPIVLLPGITANLHNFDGLIDAGLAPRFRVVGLDLRGRGLSDKPAHGYSIAEHAADWHMLQRVFVADLDPARLAASAARVKVPGAEVSRAEADT